MFTENFLWGAASAAHQIEGAYLEDGKGMGYWDYMEQQEKTIKHGERADVSCDHYHRYKEDVALMKQMGLKSYRFSISWPRVIPDGVGAVNEKGLQFYSDLVDELLKAGIEPIVTLYHWNIPLALHKQGAWQNDESPKWFEAYTRVVVDRLSDRVRYWLTFNELQMFAGVEGMMQKDKMPKEEGLAFLMRMCRNIFLAHGKAVTIIRKYGKLPTMVSMSPTGLTCIPESDSKEDIERAREKSFDMDENNFLFGNAWWADPIYLGRFPDKARELFGDKLPVFSDEEWEEISQPLDFCGFNVYYALGAFPPPEYSYDEYAYQGSPRTAMDWNVTPDVLYWSPKFLYERYHKPLMITENGMAGMDWVCMDGKVHDAMRIDFIKRYLCSLKKAVDDEIPVIGYQYWSVMDNFEWVSGFDKRFGLIYIDYRTLERTLKDSAYWYAEVIRTNGGILEE